jgi:hypothetical protein
MPLADHDVTFVVEFIRDAEHFQCGMPEVAA